ncbi:MAG: hypothetical protein ACI9JM_003201 [Halioglobus sp.]|jgi:hypothetical protein
MKKTSRPIILTLLVLSALMTYAEVTLNIKQQAVSNSTHIIWAFFYLVLVGTWLIRDNKSGNFEKAFDFSFYLYLFLPALLPYYLFRTRGMEGLVTYLGFVAIYWIPYSLGLLTAVYFS